jgi:hypothetical protein
MATHELKIDEVHFDAIVRGDKRFEWRKEHEDRTFNVGDVLHLLKNDEEGISVTVRYLVRGPAYGIPEGYVVMSIDRGIKNTLDATLFYFEHIDLNIVKNRRGKTKGDVALCPECGHTIGVRVSR